MTIDEAIKMYKKIANTDANCPRYCMRPCEQCAEEHEQLAWWLKDYKRLQGIEQVAENLAIQLTCAKEKAIDDFSEKAKYHIAYIHDGLDEQDIDDIAEQLKEDLEYE